MALAVGVGFSIVGVVLFHRSALPIYCAYCYACLESGYIDNHIIHEIRSLHINDAVYHVDLKIWMPNMLLALLFSQQ